jgi:hypothetical protein
MTRTHFTSPTGQDGQGEHAQGDEALSYAREGGQAIAIKS